MTPISMDDDGSPWFQYRRGQAYWQRYGRLFVQESNHLVATLDQVEIANRDLIPIPLRVQIQETKQQIEVEQSAYLTILPGIDPAYQNAFFKVRFQEMFRTLDKLNALADQFASTLPEEKR